ncbi:MAG: outer membrane protein transport protein [Desulfobacteraceae bacterium]|jgi:long-chain fatty acid transport protein
MKKISRALIVIGVIGVSMIINMKAHASGFALFEQSARGASRGGAFAAQADDPSAVWYNPAGITQLNDTRAMAGGTAYTGNTDTVINGKGVSSRSNGVTPNIFFTRKLNNRIWAGIGMFAPFGMSTSYDENWEGRYNTFYTGNVSVEVNPNLAYKLTDSLSAAAGVSLQTLEVKMRQKINTRAVFIQGAVAEGADLETVEAMADAMGLSAAPDITQDLSGKDRSAVRYNAALFYRMNDIASFGLSYRSRTSHHVSGDAAYSNVIPALSGDIYNTDVKGDITLPDLVWAGGAFRITPAITAEIDVNWTGWSCYKSLNITIDNALGSQKTIKNWKDVFCYRAGMEYKASDALSLRMGYLFDKSPIPDSTVDYSMPADDRHVITGGLGYSWKRWGVDVGYSLVLPSPEHRIEARPEEGILSPGTVKSMIVHQVSAAVSCGF